MTEMTEGMRNDRGSVTEVRGQLIERLEGAGMRRIEEDFVEAAFGANRFEGGLAGDLELAFEPRAYSRDQSVGGGGSANRAIDTASEDHAFDAVGPFEREGQDDRAGVVGGGCGLDDSIEATAGADLIGHG